jgi:hypothetical protein
MTEFDDKYKKFNNLVEKRKISFFGLGCMPLGKDGIDYEVWDLFKDLLKNENFTNYVRGELGIG